MIQHAMEMYLASGISEFCVITSPTKPLLKDFITGNWAPPALPFRRDTQFYKRLEACNIVILTQDKADGVADAIALAKDFVGNEAFTCVMPDCLLFSNKPFVQQLIEVFQKYRENVIGTIYIQGNDVRRFGNVGLLSTDPIDDRAFAITSISDKTREPLHLQPGAKIHKGFGGGVYLPEYFDLVEIIRSQVKGEVDDVPIHKILIKEGRLMGVLLEGAAFDAGHPLGFRAAVHCAGRLSGFHP